MTKKIRITAKNLFPFHPALVEAIQEVAARYPNIKSFSLTEVHEGSRAFFGGEGDAIIRLNGFDRLSIEMVSDSTVGAAGVSHQIGRSFAPKAGEYVLVVSYYGRYFLDVYRITEQSAALYTSELPAISGAEA